MSHNISFTQLIGLICGPLLTIRNILHDRLPDKWDEDFTPDKGKRNFQIIIPNIRAKIFYKFPVINEGW
jgi:hypothetical protein